MYVAYVRAVVDYAAPAWYPLMCQTRIDTLQRLQNRALRLILGVPRSTRIHDLHLEAKIEPLPVRWDAATAYQAEKCHRHPPDDPLYMLAHATPLRRLKQQTWQHASDDILCRVGINPSHADREDSALRTTTAQVAVLSTLAEAVAEAREATVNLELPSSENDQSAIAEAAPDALQLPSGQSDQPQANRPARHLDVPPLYHFELVNERFVPVPTSTTHVVSEPEPPLHFVMGENNIFTHPPQPQAISSIREIHFNQLILQQ